MNLEIGKFFRALKRIYRLSICQHAGYQQATFFSWPASDNNLPGEVTFCKNCGRILAYVADSEQPQHNPSLLMFDKLDDKQREVMIHQSGLRELAFKFRNKK